MGVLVEAQLCVTNVDLEKEVVKASMFTMESTISFLLILCVEDSEFGYFVFSELFSLKIWIIDNSLEIVSYRLENIAVRIVDSGLKTVFM